MIIDVFVLKESSCVIIDVILCLRDEQCAHVVYDISFRSPLRHTSLTHEYISIVVGGLWHYYVQLMPYFQASSMLSETLSQLNLDDTPSMSI